MAERASPAGAVHVLAVEKGSLQRQFMFALMERGGDPVAEHSNILARQTGREGPLAGEQAPKCSSPLVRDSLPPLTWRLRRPAASMTVSCEKSIRFIRASSIRAAHRAL